MARERSSYGLAVSALGAMLLAVSVFLPWYGLSFTATGIAYVQRVGEQLAAQLPSGALHGYLASQHASLAALAGRQFTAVSAHQALRTLNVVLLVLAGLAALDALTSLARAGNPAAQGGGAALALLGTIAVVCVLFRMVHPPSLGEGLIALSLRAGAWLALAGSAMIVAGGLWRGPTRALPSQERTQPAWSGLSGWTPQA